MKTIIIKKKTLIMQKKISLQNIIKNITDLKKN